MGEIFSKTSLKKYGDFLKIIIKQRIYIIETRNSLSLSLSLSLIHLAHQERKEKRRR
jgi:hypothetical protein